MKVQTKTDRRTEIETDDSQIVIEARKGKTVVQVGSFGNGRRVTVAYHIGNQMQVVVIGPDEQLGALCEAPPIELI